MKISLVAIGRLGNSVENGLTKDYLSRAGLCGRGLGFGAVELIEVETKKSLKTATKAQEADAIRVALGEGVIVITCDERGELLTSRQLAKRMDKLKDRGEKKLAFIIGGADGLDPEFVSAAHFSLAFGPQTWPHALARVMLAEQIYRSLTILAGLPYHRD